MGTRTLQRFLLVFTAGVAVLVVADGTSGQQPDRPADVILVSGRVYTMDPDRPRADAIAVRDGRIMFVGATGHVTALAGPATKIVNLQ